MNTAPKHAQEWTAEQFRAATHVQCLDCLEVFEKPCHHKCKPDSGWFKDGFIEVEPAAYIAELKDRLTLIDQKAEDICDKDDASREDAFDVILEISRIATVKGVYNSYIAELKAQRDELLEAAHAAHFATTTDAQHPGTVVSRARAEAQGLLTQAIANTQK